MTLGSLLGGKVKVKTPGQKDTPVQDELQAYLETEMETDMDLDDVVLGSIGGRTRKRCGRTWLRW